MNLLIGIQGKRPHLQILIEMLNHQGVIFEEVVDGTQYPCIIYTSIESEDVIKNKNFINAEKIIPMDRVETMLAGALSQSLNHPDVNEYEIKIVEEIRRVLHSQRLPFIRKWFWPNFARACCIMTHDIDRISIPPIYARRETPILIKFFLYISYYYEKYVLRVKKFSDYIDMITDIETEYGVKSSFYFFPEYKEHEEFLNILKVLKEKKFEVGLHSESENCEQLRKEKKQLEEYYCGEIFGTRQHLLKFSAPQTWQYQEKLLEYDLTFYINEEFGYRSGLCFPYRPLDTQSIIEIPTLFMDWTALNKKMGYEEIKKELQKIIEIVEYYNGCLVLNFHNEYFKKITFPHIYKSFIYILKHIQNDYWITTANECVKWWKKREETKINIEYKNGKIVGTCSSKLPIIINYTDSTTIYLNVKENFFVGPEDGKFKNRN